MPKPSKNPPSIETEGLGTRWIIEILDGQTSFPTDIARPLQQKITLFDDTYSRFKPDSLIGTLNRKYHLPHPPRELLDMFAFAHKMYVATNGAFDISVGGSLQKSGYGKDTGAKPVYPDFWKHTAYDEREISIPERSSIDFGGFGKGWLIDELAMLLEQNGCPHYLINGGGDIVLSAAEPIELGLEHPYELSKIIGTTHITKGSLAVSSVVKRRWVKDGETYHHIIDPKTMKPATNGVISTYVKGQTALIADTIATIALLRPELKGKLEELFDVRIIIVTEDQIS